MGDRYWMNVATGSTWNNARDLGLDKLSNKPAQPSQYQVLKIELNALLKQSRQAAYLRVDEFLRQKARESRLSSLRWAIDESSDDAGVKTLLEQYLKDNF